MSVCFFFCMFVSYQTFWCFFFNSCGFFLYVSCVSVFLCVLIFIDVDTERACLHALVCVRACVRIFACACVLHVLVCVRLCACVCALAHVCVCVCVCVCVRAFLYHHFFAKLLYARKGKCACMYALVYAYASM